jgi:hypothetical protein
VQTQRLTSLLQNPAQIDKFETAQLDSLLTEFPYFQAGRAIQLKGLKTQESFGYNTALRKTAAHTANRTTLFEFITSPQFDGHAVAKGITNQTERIFNIELVEPEIVTSEAPLELEKQLKSELQKAEAILDPALFSKKPASLSEQSVKTIEESIGADAPLAFKKEDRHSFGEWLSLTSAKPIERSSNDPNLPDPSQKKQFEMIDKFLAEAPKLSPTKALEKNTNLAKPFTKTSDSLMTETLAKVYVQQKNYKKAIQAYEILSLKNPEKSGFFADRIRAIQLLLDQNKEK